ncbi:MAG TPA: hypothetical protein PLL17_02490 [Defluviitaleaceae bacterium]|nr:hypothetical protein [Candidatus Epulonipiscium sp.]HOQ16060.1 hypothetical protein [Defluviitaleaceae bacterium]HPT77445.1 hypothetical protein [Defluviitaleaceae bacterium]HQD49988.1 hypothetical protein [Defluviitaleaceae bacterium]
MLKIPIEDFIEEIKAEIMSYEELGEKKALEWEKNFISLIHEKDKLIKNIEEENGKKYYCLEDESELFRIVDMYLAAVDSGEEKEYWERWI